VVSGQWQWLVVLQHQARINNLQLTTDNEHLTNMQLARILGNAVATVKHATMNGCRLLVAQPVAVDGRSPDGEPLLVVDFLGAARGDMVVITNDGRAAREMLKQETTPVRWTTVGIKNG